MSATLLALHTNTSRRAPDVVLQSELGVLAEFEARYFASLKDVADRIAAGCVIESGPLAIDGPVISSRAGAGAVVVPACVATHAEDVRPTTESLTRTLERLAPMSRLLRQADFDFMRRNGLSWMARLRLRQRRVRLYFGYLRLLNGIIDREMTAWAQHLGQGQCTFESLDRARWSISKTLWLLRLDGLRFCLHMPVESQSPARHLSEIQDLIFGFHAEAAG